MIHRIQIFSLFAIAAAIVFMAGCDHRIDVTPFQLAAGSGGTTPGDTNYIEISPPWFGFASPRAVVVGQDNLIYVADYDANEVIMMDATGAILKRRSIPHPVSIAQNTKLDLYVCGETMANGSDTIGAVYRIALVRQDSSWITRETTFVGGVRTITPVRHDTSTFYNHDLNSAPMHIVWREPGRPNRRFTGVSILLNNRYLVARTGVNNTSFVDPDTRILLFNSGDTLVTPVPDLVTRSSGGTAITDIQDLTSVYVIPSSNDMVVTQNGAEVAYAAIWMTYTSTPDFQGWLPKFDPANAAQRSTDFIRPYRYALPTAVTYDKRRREIFVVDAGLDSISKFTIRGQFKTESFGKALTARQSQTPLNHPMGISFSNDCILYVADTGNHMIRRFRLSNQSSCF